MISRIDRFRVQVLLDAGYTQAEAAVHTGVTERSVRRIAQEGAIVDLEQAGDGCRRVGNPGKINHYVESRPSSVWFSFTSFSGQARR